MKVYLGGPIKGCTDEEARGWRTEVKAIFDAAGIGWLDPMERDYRGRELEPGIAREIVEGDKLDISQCHALLMNAPKPSVGTSMEILYGWERGKKVFVVLPEGDPPSPWIIEHSHEIFRGAASVAAREIAGRFLS